MFLQMHLRGRAIYGIQATMICVEQLPDDPALLKCMLVEQHACHEAEKEAAIRAAVAAEIQAAVDEAVQAAVAKAIKETTALFLRRFYGPRNERFDPRQLLLFGLKIDEMPLDEASIADESQEDLVTRRVAKRHKHGAIHCRTTCRGSTSSTISTTRRSRARPAANCASGSARR